MTYQVTAPIVKVSIGSPGGNRIAQILHEGAIVPDGVAEETLDLLAARGRIVAIDEPDLDDEPADAPVPPAKAGPGSGVEAWRAYAAALDVDIDSAASRDDVIAAIAAAGKPTE